MVWINSKIKKELKYETAQIFDRYINNHIGYV